ncbi:MAG TPA: FtsX-like permease family protein [Anaerolineales bacterium]|nr:FtsX-like permease family protein [Anaerolineales bacterium]
MIFKNLFRRKARTALTILGIAIGVAAIIALGVMASLLENGFSSMMTGSKSDLLLSQPDTFSLSYSAVDETIVEALAAMPEVAQVSGMVQDIVQTPENPFFFIFGYPAESYILERYQIVEGYGLDSLQAEQARGNPLLLGVAAADALGKTLGDSLLLGESLFRIVGIYHTGDAFEDRGAVIELADAQLLFNRTNTVSIIYIQLKDPGYQGQFDQRIQRLWPDLLLSSTDQFTSRSSMVTVMQAYVVGIAGLAVLLGGVGMMNAQLMSVLERTREIGVLRAVGWSGWRVLTMILGESLVVSLLGGAAGVVSGWLALQAVGLLSPLLAGMAGQVTAEHLARAFMVVLPVGLIGGAYPAWRASRLPPVEALRYEGGTTGAHVHRLPLGGMAVQSLWQRTGRTLLTLSAIAITVGSIMALEGIVRGMADAMVQVATGSGAEIMVRERDTVASALSSMDERIASRVAVLPEVKHVSRMVLTAITLPEAGGMFMLQGYSMSEAAITRFPVVEGEPLSANRQILLGRAMATALNKSVGDTIELSGKRLRITGIFETGVSWEEMGGVVTLRDAQTIMGKPRQITMLAVRVADLGQAAVLVERINQEFPEARADLTGEFVEQLPDMQYTNLVMSGISLLAIFVGGLAVLNTMLMSVLERTREIGVLRALGWRRDRILRLIMGEAILLGLLGGVIGVGFAFLVTSLLQQLPGLGQALTPAWAWDVFLRAVGVALILGGIGGVYPAYRATLLQPVEALRYE